MKKIGFLLILAAAVTVVGKFAYPAFMRSAFCLSGEINMSHRLLRLTKAPNTVCYLIVKNQCDVPVAIKRYINPVFPLKFRVTAVDLMLADSWDDPLKLEVQVNSHGNIGQIQAGDIFAKYDRTVRLRADNISIFADKMLGVPSLVAHAEPDKGSYLFSIPAR